MCIIGCAPKMKLSDDVSLILKGEKEFEDLKKDLDYLFEETIFPVMFNPKEITDFGKKYHHKTRSKVLKLQYSKLTEWVKVFVKEAKILKNNYLFQGTMATAEGTAKSPNTTGRFLNILSHIVYHEE
ncbi:MAG: hypothetical protein KKF89_05835, partial [Nanoarchaeota archaeon]|nr:hypothetical protein [Nanoarchaeota archaeon]